MESAHVAVDGLPIDGVPFRRLAGDRTNSLRCRHQLISHVDCKLRKLGFVLCEGGKAEQHHADQGYSRFFIFPPRQNTVRVGFNRYSEFLRIT